MHVSVSLLMVIHHLCTSLKEDVEKVSWLFIEAFAKIISLCKHIGIPFTNSIIYQLLFFLVCSELLLVLLAGNWGRLVGGWISLMWGAHDLYSCKCRQHLQVVLPWIARIWCKRI